MSKPVELKEEIFRSTEAAVELLGTEKPIKTEIEIRGRITRDAIEEISRIKKEPEWMTRLRLKSLEFFYKLPTPKWVKGIESIDLEDLIFYVKPDVAKVSDWDDLPPDFREYYDRLGLPEIEKKMLAGLTSVFDSETIYAKVKKYLEERGVIVMPIEEAVHKYPDLIKEYFLRVFPYTEHKFAALHGALWSGGVFVYVPKGVKIKEPIESFFIIGRSSEGQFEHSLIVGDEGSEVTWIEGCSAPRLSRYSFHDGMVEAYAHRGAKVKIVTIQNWSRDVINFNNKRGIAEENARVDWVEGSIGSKITYVYPSTILKGDYSATRNTVIQLAKGPVLKDTGSKVIHVGKMTRGKIINKSVSVDGGINTYRGIVRVVRGAKYAVSNVECEAMIFDEKSQAYTYPHNQVDEPTATVSHEARTGRLSEAQLFYLQSRGLEEDEAKSLMVLGLLDEIMVELPFEYINVLSKVIQLEFKKLGGYG
ncbi:MAG: Fe-S cluster assembly protein SufB [Thermoprotei archaeon]|nr:Fe-S cluster assembly protein SufB [Thermoprotei archaeon]